MSVQDQYGNLVVRSLVADASGTEVQSIVSGSNSTPVRHVVEIKNWSTIPYDISVEVVLPQGRQRLSFDGATDRWTANIWSLARRDTERDGCGITASGGRTGKERVHCTAVKWKKAGRHRWTDAKSRLPLSLTVNIT